MTGLYFVAFILMGSLLVVNLIIGKVVALYMEQNQKDTLMMTPGQCEWILVSYIGGLDPHFYKLLR